MQFAPPYSNLIVCSIKPTPLEGDSRFKKMNDRHSAKFRLGAIGRNASEMWSECGRSNLPVPRFARAHPRTLAQECSIGTSQLRVI
jgi:hypothetical protein